MLDEGGALKCADTESPWKSSLSLSESNQIPQRCAVFPSHFSTFVNFNKDTLNVSKYNPPPPKKNVYIYDATDLYQCYHISNECCSFQISVNQRIQKSTSFHKNIKQHNCFEQ